MFWKSFTKSYYRRHFWEIQNLTSEMQDLLSLESPAWHKEAVQEKFSNLRCNVQRILLFYIPGVIVASFNSHKQYLLIDLGFHFALHPTAVNQPREIMEILVHDWLRPIKEGNFQKIAWKLTIISSPDGPQLTHMALRTWRLNSI